MQIHIRKVYACLAVTWHLHFWQNDRDLLCATAVTRGWSGYRNLERYVAHTPGDLMCPLCNTAYEDEMHTLFYCKFLDGLRQKYIPRKYTAQPSYVTLRRMMQDKSCLHDLGRFSYHSNKRARYDQVHSMLLFLEPKFKPRM